MESHSIIYVAAAVIATGVIILLALRLRKREKGRSTAPAQASVEVSKPRPDASQWPLADAIRLFSNETGGLWLLASNGHSSVTRARKNFTNLQTTVRLNGNDAQKKWWQEFSEGSDSWTIDQFRTKAGELIELLMASGLTHANDTELLWADNSDAFYNTIDEINSGEKCKIVTPAWLYNGVLFEKGFVKLT